jgi:hypothetical protein
MEAIDRRSVLLGMLSVAAAASLGASSLPSAVEAMPIALDKDLATKAGDLKQKVQAVARPPRRPVARPPRRPPRHRRRRRWVCSWHRGRRVCGWRW